MAESTSAGAIETSGTAAGAAKQTGDEGVRIQPGVETLTITGAAPGTHLRVDTAGGQPVVTLVADHIDNAHVSFVPLEHEVLATKDDMVRVVRSGEMLAPGDYVVLDVSSEPAIEVGTARVMAVDDHPDPSLYEQEIGAGVGYMKMRDGVTLSYNTWFPNEDLYGPAPWRRDG